VRSVLPVASVVLLPHAASAAAGDALGLLKEAKTQLEPISSMIEDGNWDGVRNVLKTAPLRNVKNLAKAYVDESGFDELMGPREDFVQAAQFLDTFVYNNIFISEQNAPGRKGSGVTKDYATPLGYLSDCKAALQEIIEFKP